MKVKNIFVRTQTRTYCFTDVQTPSDILLKLQDLQAFPPGSFRLTHNSKPLPQNLPENCTVLAHLPLVGGKGGFGAKLKNEGSKKVRSNNTNHSRDLTGRRIKNVNMEKDYIESYKKKLQEDKIVKEEREKFKQMENTLYEEHAFMRLDKNYTAQLEDGAKDIQDAVKMGLVTSFKKNMQAVAKELDKQNKDKEQQLQHKPQYQPGLEKKSQEKDQESKPEAAKESPSPLEQEFLNEDKPRKIMRQEPVPMDKVQAEKVVTEIMNKQIEAKPQALSNAASKLKSLFKK